jgi:hypothetical protein
MSSSISPQAASSSDGSASRVDQAELEVRATCAAILTLAEESRNWKVLEDSKGVKIVQKEVSAGG